MLLLILVLTFTIMLGSRTKQVFSYGKRSKRIVNVSEVSSRPKDTVSIFDDMEPTKWAPLVSRMKKRENLAPKTPSPKVIRMTRKKRLSPVLSAPRKRTRVAQILDAEAPKRKSYMAKPMADASGSKSALDTNAIHPRKPFGHFPLNVPGSPATQAVWSPPATGTPLERSRLFSPLVDMTIILLDENGKAVKQERRGTRTDIVINPSNQGDINKPKSLFMQGKPSQPPTDSTDSDADLVEQPQKQKRLARRAPLTIYSDESESDESPAPIPQAHKKSSTPRVVNVVIPPPPYPIRPTESLAQIPSSQLVSLPCTLQALPLPYATTTLYQLLPSPPLRPRQLTPIRGSRSRHFFEPPSPPSPTCTEFDLSLELEELTLASSSRINTSCRAEPEHPTYLQPLLEECHQETCGPIEFSSFIDTFPFDPIVQSEASGPTGITFRKIGEASYSEVFGIGDVVLKVIPLRDESTGDTSTSKLKLNVKYNDSGEVEDGPAPSDAKDVRKEIIVTRAMGEVCDGFVKLLRTYIVRGKYPEVLLRLWDEYHETKGSESVRPGMYTSRLASSLYSILHPSIPKSDTFLVSQVYAIIVLPNGGLDLEAYKFVNASKMGWRQACSLFWQVAKALAHAEQLVSFEVRAELSISSPPFIIGRTASRSPLGSNSGQEHSYSQYLPPQAAEPEPVKVTDVASSYGRLSSWCTRNFNRLGLVKNGCG